jgi:hypothetical protein
MKKTTIALLAASIVFSQISCNKPEDDVSTQSGKGLTDWTAATHGKGVEPNYAVVFPQNQVNTLEIKMTSADWTAIKADMLVKKGTAFGSKTGGTTGGGMPPTPDPVYYAKYKTYVKDFNDNVFTTSKMNELFERNTNLITPFVNGTEKEVAPYSNLANTAAFTSALSVLKQHVISRNQAVATFLK